MTPRPSRSLRFVALALIAACAARGPGEVPGPRAAEASFARVLAEAAQDVQAGRHAAADRRLLGFQQANPAAPEALEAAYYRALYKLDPANGAGSTREAVTLLDAMLATPIVTSAQSPRQSDATVLRRLAVALDAHPDTVKVATPGAGGSASARGAEESRAKDEEIARLREELKGASAELERIKRRVATPKP